MPEQVSPDASMAKAGESINLPDSLYTGSITKIASAVDGHLATALPDITPQGTPEADAAGVNLDPTAAADTVASGTSEKSGSDTDKTRHTGKTPTRIERDKMTAEYRGLTSAEIASRIDERFFKTGRLSYSEKRRKGGEVEDIVVVNGSQMDRRLFDHARHLQDLSTEYAQTLGIKKEQEVKNAKQAAREQVKAAENARKRIELAVGDSKVPVLMFDDAHSLEEINNLTDYWVEKGYVKAYTDDEGEVKYLTPQSAAAQLDKGRVLTGNSILDYRKEALARINRKPGDPVPPPAPVFAEQDQPTALDRLVKMDSFKPDEAGDSLPDRLACLDKAFKEADDDSDELELVISQAFRQGLLFRDVTEDPDTTNRHTSELKAVDPSVDTWYRKAMAHYQTVLSHSDEEQEAAEQETSFPYTEKSAGWIKSRIKMFKRRS
jgi:hypothetical protein